MGLNVSYSEAFGADRPGGRRRRTVTASLGEIRMTGRNRPEAARALASELERIAQHPWPTLIRTADGTVLAVGVGRYDIMSPGEGSTYRSSSVMTGESYAETLEAARRHAAESYGGIR